MAGASLSRLQGVDLGLCGPEMGFGSGIPVKSGLLLPSPGHPAHENALVLPSPCPATSLVPSPLPRKALILAEVAQQIGNLPRHLLGTAGPTKLLVSV